MGTATFADHLGRAAAYHGDNDAIIFEDRRLTFRELAERSRRLANALSDAGVRPGDRVATLGDNRMELLELACGVALGGFVRCPMYTHNTADTNLYLLNHLEVSALVADESYLAELADHLHEIPSLKLVVVFGQGPGTPYDSLLAAGAPTDPGVVVDEDEPHIIRFSAGTTGRPKGIVHTARAWRALTNELVLTLPRIEETDTFIAPGPLSHGSGLWIWEMLARGARHVVMPSFEAGRFLELVEKYRCTHTILVPTMIQLICSHPDARNRDLTSLKAVYYGAAPISETTAREAVTVWGEIMYQGYGQSEAMPLTILEPRHHVGGEGSANYIRSAGRPTPNTFVKILDDEDNQVGAGEIGEVCVRTPAAMKELWRDAEATAARFTPDGYVRTRDIGYLTGDGFLFLADRKEDMIISGGFNVWPAEVENALAGHPSVFEASVVGVPHEKWGETVVAVVRLRDGARADEQELIEWCRREVGSVKRPTQVKFADEPLPKNSIGKLLRRKVREDYWGASDTSIHGA